MKNWKDRIWLLVLVIVGSSIMTFCKSGGSGGGNSTTNSTTNLAFANGFKPSDISGVMICSTSSGGTFNNCYSDSDNSSFSITLSSLFSQGWRPVGPLYSTGNGHTYNTSKSGTIFYK